MTEQQYEQYTNTDHAVWSILYTRQLETIRQVAYRNFIKGVEQLGFSDKKIPDFKVMNKKLEQLTGWQIYAVPGLISNSSFFERMKVKQFGATTWIRKQDELDYLEEPDMFHDVFGHIPLLTDPLICDYLYRMAKLAVKYIDNEDVIESVARLYWYTIEFGLVTEKSELKIYGAGILSSIGETEYCLSDKATLVPFDLQEIVRTPYIKDTFQKKYFVLQSFSQLPEAVLIFEQQLEHKYQKKLFRSIYSGKL
jgi:phenylalanine-4-hydroxylase